MLSPKGSLYSEKEKDPEDEQSSSGLIEFDDGITDHPTKFEYYVVCG